jgi:hypothetical protein
MVELRMLGAAIDAEYEQRDRRAIAAPAEDRARRRAARLPAKTKARVESPDGGISNDEAWLDEIPFSDAPQEQRGHRVPYPASSSSSWANDSGMPS